MASKYVAGILSLPSSLLSLIAILPMGTVAQNTTPSPMPEATLSTPASFSRNEATRSMTTSFTSSAANTNTSSSAASTNTPTATDLFPSIGHPDDPRDGVFQYYWLILVIFGILVMLFLWWVNRRRRKRKEQLRLSAQNALARDMEGWINTRRWFHGSWRTNHTRDFIRREEGLNEHGEAPPPYQPSGDVTVAQDPATGLEIPLRTLCRGEVDTGRPPEYRETISGRPSSRIQPDTANPQLTPSGNSESPHGSSIRNLMPDGNRPRTSA